MKKRNLKKPIISALEQRILFDGAAVATAVDVLDNSSFTSNESSQTTSNDVTKNNAENSVHEAQAVQGFERDRREVAFIDITVKDYQTLADGVGEGVEVYLVSSLAEINTILETQTNIDAIHILSHGNTGEITVGNDVLNSDTLNNNTQLLETMKNSLSENGDILLYGCNVASDGTGQEFINSIATLTQADVAASEDTTGNSALGGDWVLEKNSGSIETDNFEIMAYDSALLAVSFTGDSGNTNSPNATVNNYSPQSSISITNTATNDTLNISTTGTNYYQDTATTFSNLGITPLSGGTGMLFYADNTNFTNSITFTIQGNKVFDFNKILLQEINDETDTFTFTPNGDVSKRVTFSFNNAETKLIDLSSNTNFDGITSLTISTLDNQFQASFDNIEVENIRSASDTTAPTFDVAPATSNVTATTVDLSASLDEAGKIYYVVVADGATAPTVAQIKAGQDSTGASALKSGNSDVTTTPFTGTYNITGLSANTAYDIYVVGQDDEGTPNVMATATKVDVTMAGLPPVFSSTSTTDFAENATGTVYDAELSSSTGTVTYTLSGTDSGKFDINSTTGILTFKSAPDYETPTDNGTNNVYNVIIRATDNNGYTEQNVAINVTAVNEAPVITSSATVAIDENIGAGQVVYTVTSTDVDASATVTYSLSGTDASLFTIDSTSGEVTLIANPNFENKSSYSFNVIATDNGTLTDTQAVTLSINDVNEAPVITSSATVAIDENIGAGQVVYTVTSTDVDASATVTYSLSGTDASLFTIDSTSGEVTLIANPNFENKSSYSFNVIATDNGTLTDTQAVTLSINDVNEAPVITSSATVAIDENIGAGQVVYTVTSTDVDASATVTYSLSGTDASLFTIDSTSGEVTLIANPNFENKSSYSFNVIATDNGTLTDTQAVTLSINDVNEAPVITSSATVAIDENIGAGQVVYTVTSTDVDASATVTYSLSGTDASLFTIDSTSGEVTLIANPNFENKSSYSFNVIATDNGTLTDTQAVTLSINDVNEAPVITSSATVAIDENIGAGQVVYTVTSTDVDASATVTYSLSGTDASLFTIDSTSGEVTLIANPNFENKSSYSFNVIATDNGTLTDTQAVTLSINDVNEAPVITSSATVAIDENIGAGQVVYTVTSTDVDASATVTYSLSGTDASLFTIDSTSGEVTLIANPNFENKSSYSFNVIATDNGTLTDTQAVTLSINDVNEAPVITSSATVAIDENIGAGQVVYTVTSTDVDASATVTYSLSGTDASLFTIDSTSGEVTLIANPNFENKSSYSFNVIATDNGTLTDTQAVTLSINDVNEAPVITSSATVAIDENIGAGQVVYTVTSTDVDASATVTYSLSGTDASLFTIDSTSGEVTLIANPNFENKSSYSFNVIATDNGTLTDTQAVTLSINDVNEAPVITSSATVAIDENIGAGQVVYTVTSTDVDASATVTYSLSGTDASLFTIDSTSGEVTLIANPNFENKSSYSFNVIATDNGTLTDTQAVTLSINDVNEAPVITSSATVAIDENIGAGQVVYTVTSTDVDASATVTYSLSGTDASLFTIDSTSGEVTLIANPNFENKSSYSFNVIATDNGTLTDTQAVTLSINDVNEAPVITSSATVAIDENIGAGQVVYTVTSTDVDASATVTYSLSGTDASLFTIDSTSGEVTLIANPNFENKSSYSFNVIATDNGTLTDTQAVTLSINDVNEAPVITSSATVAIDENIGAGQVVYTVTSTDVDASATVSYSLSGTDASLFTIDSTSGEVTLIANPNFENKSSYSFNVIATDNGTLTDTQAVTLSINDVNEAPVITSSATVAIDENIGAGQVVYTVTSTDVDASATVSYSLSGTDASLFTIDSTSGEVTLIANPNFENKSSYSFNVIATDNGTLTDTQAVTLSINDVNEAPVITSSATVAIDENIGAGQVVYTVTSTDVDASATVTYSLSGTDASLFTIDSTSGEVTLIANPNFENKSSYSFNVIATDNGTLTDTQAVTLSINDVNEAPVITSSATVAIDENIGAGQVVYTVTSTDVDASATVTYSLSGTDASLFTIDSTSGEVTLIANPNFENKSSYSFNVIATDNGTLTDTQAVTLSINDVNEAPVGSLTIVGIITQGETLTVTNNITDDEGLGTLSYQWYADGVLINGAVNTTYTLTQNDVNKEITVIASYEDGLGANETVTSSSTSSVENVNDVPTVSSKNINIQLSFGDNYIKDISGLFNDIDFNNTFIYEAINLPDGLTINPSTGIISGKVNQSGEFVITLKVTDNGTPPLSVSKTYTMLVIAPAQAESSQTKPIETPVDSTLTKNVADMGISTFADTLSLGTINNILDDGGVGEGYLNTPTTQTQQDSSNQNNADNAVQTIQTNRNNSGNYIEADANLNVGINGQISFDKVNQDSFSIVGITIEDMKIENNRLEIKVVDTSVAQNFIVTQTDGSALPTGMSFDPRTGNISGTVPENLDKLDITIKATNPDGTTRVLNIKIDLKKLKEANRADGEKYIGLKDQLAIESQKLEGYGNYLVSLFA